MKSKYRWLWVIVWVACQWIAFSMVYPPPSYGDDCLTDPLNAADCMRTPGFRPAIAVIVSVGGTLATILVNVLGGTASAAGAASVSPGEQSGIPGESPIPSWLWPTTFGGPDDHPFTKYIRQTDCHRPGIPAYSVNTATLGLVVCDTVFEGRGTGPRLTIDLTYNAGSSARGMFGKGWRFGYESSLVRVGDVVRLTKGSGQVLEYRLKSSGNGASSPNLEVWGSDGVFDSLHDEGASWLLLEKDTHLRYRYVKPVQGDVCLLSSITDVSGNTLQMQYNPDGTLQAITDAAGRVTRFAYHANRLCSSFTLADGRTAHYVYDASGCLIQAVDLQGIVASYEYDEDGLMRSMAVERDEKAASFTYQAIPGGKCISSVADAGGGVTRYEIVSIDSHEVRVTSPEGQTTTYHSQDGLTTLAVDADGASTEFAYEAGLPVQIRDRNGGVRRMSYDDRANLVRFEDAAGGVTVFEYDADDHVVSRTDALGNTWRYEYEDGLLTRLISPLAYVERYKYDALGRLAVFTNPGGRSVFLDYDEFGNALSLTDALGREVHTESGPAGLQAAAMTDPRGYTSRYEYDGNDRLVKIIHPDGTAREMHYNCCAVAELVDENGSSWRVRRDGRMLITEESDPAGNRTVSVYDGSNRLVERMDPLNRSWRIRHDDLQRAQTVIDPAGGQRRYQYDALANLIEVTDEMGRTTRFSYDARSLPTRTADALGRSLSIASDAVGRPETITTGRGSEVRLVYDAQGQIVQKRVGDIAVADYEYSENGVLVGVREERGTTQFDLDGADQVVAVQYPDGRQLRLVYDGGGNLGGLTYPGGLKVEYLYDSRDRLTEMRWGDQVVVCEYDGLGNLIRMTRSNGTESTYSFDASNSISEIRHVQGSHVLAQIAYEYDAVGNVTGEDGVYPVEPAWSAASLGVVYDDANQMVVCGGEQCGYDADGNLTLIGGGRWRAIYDAENRPVEVTRNGQMFEYRYDGLGNRVLAVAPDGSVRRFYHDPFGRLLVESDADGRVLAQYIYAGGLLAARVSGDGETQYYHFDRNGSTLALTDRRGQVAAAYAYDPFGVVVGRTGDDLVVDDWGNPFTYVGAFGVMDEGDGLFFMKHRYYDAATGRFIQKDPLGFTDGLNLYTYVSNNPVSWIDPEGQAKANWMVMLNGATNVFVGGVGIFVGTTLAFVSVVDPTALPTAAIRVPVIVGTFSAGAKGWFKGFRQISEGWHGSELPEGWEAVRESPLGNIPFVEMGTYAAEGKPIGVAYEGAKELVPGGNLVDIYESASPGGKNLIDCDRPLLPSHPPGPPSSWNFRGPWKGVRIDG